MIYHLRAEAEVGRGKIMEALRRFLSGIIKRLRGDFCEHEWRMSKFQKLTDDHTVTCVCNKCGKIDQLYITSDVSY